MNATINVGEQVSFSPHRMLLVYQSSRDAGGVPGSWFVTEHTVEIDSRGVPVPNPGVLLSRESLEELVKKVQGTQPVNLLPENVLVYTSNRITWWVPPSVRTMFYYCDRSPELKVLNGKKFPQPPLLFDVEAGRLTVFAINEATRPTEATKLYRAPYWNVFEKGDVCLGSTHIPNVLSLDALPAWEDGFFASEFTHQNSCKNLTTHPDGFVGLWKELMGKKTFPVKYLAEYGQTLGQYLTT